MEEAVSKRKEGATPYAILIPFPAPVPMEANPLKYLNKNLNYKRRLVQCFIPDKGFANAVAVKAVKIFSLHSAGWSISFGNYPSG